MSPPSTPKFKAGDTVRRLARTADVGVVVAEPRCINGQFAYRVNFSGRFHNLAEDDLESAIQCKDARELFLTGSFGDAESCQLFLTWLRVSGGLSNYVYSFYNSRTKFYPHQFKPLVKFLDNSQGRILLADEVGLGKTIETGFVFLEMVARGELNRALIICPSKLRQKWRREMLERFDLDFTIMNSKQFVGLTGELQNNLRTEFRVIVSYETIRSERISQAIADCNLEIDILVADEAHVFRNSGTNTYGATAQLADRSNKALFLTATPINNRSEDLFNILRLLDPHSFSDIHFFEEKRNVNRHVVELERIVRNGDKASRIDIERIFRTLEPWRKGHHFFEKAKRLISADTSIDWVEVQRCVSKFNLLGNHIVRTRRVDVEEKRPKRRPFAVRLKPHPLERELYQQVFQVLMEHYDSFRLPVMNVERILSSSMPAFIDHYLKVCGRSESSAEWDDQDDAKNDDAVNDVQTFAPSFVARIGPLLSKYGRPIIEQNIDTKFTALLHALKTLSINDDPNGKVIIFSYFRKTIEYLSDRLNREGYGNIFIHGGVPTNPDVPDEDERELRRRRFQFDPETRIMLSSEVGSEGLDFQFAHVVVNYDLPWNPMRVEQRIGRIDRIGQASESLLIYSLLLNDTVDDAIYDRLLNKIGVFSDSLGDLEGIVGDPVDAIRQAVFDPKLTSIERIDQLEHAGEVLRQRIADIRELEKDTAKILGPDQYIKDEIERIKSSRRYVGPEEISRLVRRVLGNSPLNLNIVDEHAPYFTARIGATTRQYFNQHMDQERESNLFRRVLERKELCWTFDYDAASNRPDVQLFNLRHPAVRAICRRLREDATHLNPTFKVQCPRKANDVFSGGVFVIGVFLVEYQGAFHRKDLVVLAWDCGLGSCLDETQSGAMLGRLLEDVQDLETIPVDASSMSLAVERLESQASKLFFDRRVELEGEDRALYEERRQQIFARMERDLASQAQRRQSLEQQLSHETNPANARRSQNLKNLLLSVDATVQRIREKAEEKTRILPEHIRVETSWSLESLGIVEVH